MAHVKLFQSHEGYPSRYRRNTVTFEDIDVAYSLSQEAYQTTMEIGRTISQAIQASYAIEKIHDRLMEARSEHSLNDRTLEVSKVAVESIARSLGMRKMPRVSMESYYSSESDDKKDEGGFIGFIKKIWNAIVKAFEDFWNWVKGLFGAAEDTSEKIAKKAEEILENTEEEDALIKKMTESTIFEELSKPEDQQSIITKAISKELEKHVASGEKLTDDEKHKVVSHILNELKRQSVPDGELKKTYAAIYSSKKNVVLKVLAVLDSNKTKNAADVFKILHGDLKTVITRKAPTADQEVEKIASNGMTFDQFKEEVGKKLRSGLQEAGTKIEADVPLDELIKLAIASGVSQLTEKIQFKASDSQPADLDDGEMIERLYQTDLVLEKAEVLRAIITGLDVEGKAMASLEKASGMTESATKAIEKEMDEEIKKIEQEGGSEDHKKITKLKLKLAHARKEAVSKALTASFQVFKNMLSFYKDVVTVMGVQTAGLPARVFAALVSFNDPVIDKKLLRQL